MKNISEILKLMPSGEHQFFFENDGLWFEGVINIPDQPSNIISMIGHPHSLQGGTMNNKVVTTAARACRDLNIISVRFNFRGVGSSSGTFDHGISEGEDCIALCKQILHVLPAINFIFIGFSFGSFVTYRAACNVPNLILISIAPPVPRFNFNNHKPLSNSWHVIMGDNDEVVEPEEVINFCHNKEILLHLIPQTGHFFHGKLLILRDLMNQILTENL